MEGMMRQGWFAGPSVKDDDKAAAAGGGSVLAAWNSYAASRDSEDNAAAAQQVEDLIWRQVCNLLAVASSAHSTRENFLLPIPPSSLLIRSMDCLCCCEFQSIDSGEGSSTPPPLARIPEPSRKWRDIFWLAIFVLHLLGLGLCLAILGMDIFRGLNRFQNLDRLSSSGNDKTEFYWPMYATAAAIGSLLAWLWLPILCLCADQMVKIVVHSVTTYLAVIAVFCFWHIQIFWGVVFAVGAFVQFLYSMSVMDRLPFTMLVLRKSVGLVRAMPSVIRVSYGFLAVMLMWMVIWTFGVSGVVASGMEKNDGLHWWVLVVLSVSLFWTGAIVCNTLHVVVAGLVTLVLRQGAPMPRHPLLRTL